MKWLLHDFACPFFFFFWFYVRTGFFFILMTCTWCFIENTFFPCTRFMERNPFNECSIKQIPINLVPQDSRDRVASGALSIFFKIKMLAIWRFTLVTHTYQYIAGSEVPSTHPKWVAFLIFEIYIFGAIFERHLTHGAQESGVDRVMTQVKNK